MSLMIYGLLFRRQCVTLEDLAEKYGRHLALECNSLSSRSVSGP